MSIDREKYIKKIDVDEEKGKIFVYLHHRKHNSPELIREILGDKYILGDLHANLTTLYVFETPVKKKKTAPKKKPATKKKTTVTTSTEVVAESSDETVAEPTKKTTTTSRSRNSNRRKTTE